MTWVLWWVVTEEFGDYFWDSVYLRLLSLVSSLIRKLVSQDSGYLATALDHEIGVFVEAEMEWRVGLGGVFLGL